MGDDGSRLTQKGWSLLGAAVGLFVGSRLLGIVEIAMLALTIGALIGLAGVWTSRARLRLSASRSVHPQRTIVGEDVLVELRIVNDARAPSPPTSLSDVYGDGRRAARIGIPSLAADDSERATYRIFTERRGRFEVGPLVATLTDPFGLVRRRIRLLEADDLIVRPALRRLARPEMAGPNAPNPSHDARGIVGDGDEFRSLREYEQGDDLRYVHWRSTAHRDQLMIRQHELPRGSAVQVYLDLRPDGHDAASVERSVEATASLVFSFSELHRSVEVLLSTGEILRGDVDVVLDQLAIIDVRAEDRSIEVLSRRRRGALLVVVTPSVEREVVEWTPQLARGGPVIVIATRVPTGTPSDDVPVVDGAGSMPLEAAWDLALTSWNRHVRRSNRWIETSSPGSPARR